MDKKLLLQFNKISRILKGAKNVLIASHQDPDPDAVGSVLALHHCLKREGFNSFPFLPNLPSKNLDFLAGFSEIKSELSSFNPEIIFGLDYGDFGRLKLPDSFSKKEIITIDHHQRGDHRGKVQVICPQSSSTAEIIYHWLKQSGRKIDLELANCLLVGIVSDSGGFRHFSTSAETLAVAADLISKGGSLSKAISQTLAVRNPTSFSKIWGKVLTRTEVDPKTKLAYSWINFEESREMQNNFSKLGRMANLISIGSPSNLGLFLIEERKGEIKASLRAECYSGKRVDAVARKFGGGGHPFAASFKKKGTIKGVLKEILKVV